MTYGFDDLYPRIVPSCTRNPDAPAMQPRRKPRQDNHSKRIRQH
jgi:hypothetical protein